MPDLIDSHVHVWDLTGGPYGTSYPWIPEGPLHRTHRLSEIEPTMAELAVRGIVLVQAADSLAETNELLRVAADAPLPANVVGWLPLANADQTAQQLDALSGKNLVGIRHLIHDEADAKWLLRRNVAEGLEVIESAGLTFDAVAERPDLLEQVPTVAARHPDLTIVLDHIGKPPVSRGWTSAEAQQWARLIAEIAEYPTVVAKLSGLATVSNRVWNVEDWRPFTDHALACFGAERLMLGSDWPIATLNGDYRGIMNALLRVLDGLTTGERRSVSVGTAERVYRLGAPYGSDHCP